VKLKTRVQLNMIATSPQHTNSHLNDVLQIISDAARLYPDSRNLARHHAELLAHCGWSREALNTCEAFLVRFGVDEELLRLALHLRRQVGTHDRFAESDVHSISLCMIVKNEEKNLPACLASLKPVVDEMIVVDTGSTDRTVDIATVFGAKVSTFEWNGNFSDARNRAIDMATGGWILVMDADEVLAVQDYETVRHAINEASNKKLAWSVLTRNYTARVNAQGWIANDGAYLREERTDGWHPSWKVRLFPRDRRIFFRGEVHEMLEDALRQSGVRIIPAAFVVHHYGELFCSPEELTNKQRRYFDLGKEKLAERPNDLVALAELAVQAGELELFDDALVLWDRVLALRPGTVEALFNKSYIFISLKRYREGLEAAHGALNREPEHKEAAYNYGTCALYVDDPDAAIAIVAPILLNHPGYPLLQALLTVLYLVTGQHDLARTTYANLESLNYAITDYIRDRANDLDTVGRSDMARKLRTGGTLLGGQENEHA
jgi:glycosyltransferase involved in cell wall biosynthesis